MSSAPIPTPSQRLTLARIALVERATCDAWLAGCPVQPHVRDRLVAAAEVLRLDLPFAATPRGHHAPILLDVPPRLAALRSRARGARSGRVRGRA